MVVRIFFIFLLIAPSAYSKDFFGFTPTFEYPDQMTSIRKNTYAIEGYELEHTFFINKKIGISLGYGEEFLWLWNERKYCLSLNAAKPTATDYSTVDNPQYKFYKIGFTVGIFEIYKKFPFDETSLDKNDKKVSNYTGANLILPLKYGKNLYITPYVGLIEKQSFEYLGTIDWKIHKAKSENTIYGIKFGYGW
jgi:hypothetical protein